MACLAEIDRSLTDEGWLVNQSRMWAASHWTVRTGQRWQDGERGRGARPGECSVASNPRPTPADVPTSGRHIDLACEAGRM